MTEWQWDPSLYLGSAAYYANGRMPYSPGVIEAIRETLGLDGTGRVLDVGCGPGSLTLPLAPWFEQTVAIDADPGMIEAGRAAAQARRVRSIEWHQMRAEELPADLGRFRLVGFAQSFHWTDHRVVVPAVAGMLEEGGYAMHLGATTDKGSGQNARTPLGYPQPPWEEVAELVRSYLGLERRAGQGSRPDKSWGNEREAFAAAGFGEPQTVEVPNYIARVRTVDEVVAAVYSLSYSAPHLFDERRAQFEAQLRELLNAHAAAGGLFAEQTGSATLTFWPAPAVRVPTQRTTSAKTGAAAPRKAAQRGTSTRKTTTAKTSAARQSSRKTTTTQAAVTTEAKPRRTAKKPKP